MIIFFVIMAVLESMDEIQRRRQRRVDYVEKKTNGFGRKANLVETRIPGL